MRELRFASEQVPAALSGVTAVCVGGTIDGLHPDIDDDAMLSQPSRVETLLRDQLGDANKLLFTRVCAKDSRSLTDGDVRCYSCPNCT